MGEVIMANIKDGAQTEASLDDRSLLLATNHRYFMREVVAIVCELSLTSVIYAFFVWMCLVLTGAGASDGAVVGTIFVCLASLAYLALIIFELAKVISLHKKVTRVEDACIFTIDGEEWDSVHQMLEKRA